MTIDGGGGPRRFARRSSVHPSGHDPQPAPGRGWCRSIAFSSRSRGGRRSGDRLHVALTSAEDQCRGPAGQGVPASDWVSVGPYATAGRASRRPVVGRRRCSHPDGTDQWLVARTRTTRSSVPETVRVTRSGDIDCSVAGPSTRPAKPSTRQTRQCASCQTSCRYGSPLEIRARSASDESSSRASGSATNFTPLACNHVR